MAALNPDKLGPGQEQHSIFTVGGKRYAQYDYRAADGELFSCVGRTLAACRVKRNDWLAARDEQKSA